MTLTVLFGVAGFAQETLTWEECFARAVSNNLNLSAGRLKLEEAEVALKSQKSVYLPEISADGKYGSVGTKNKNDSDWHAHDTSSVGLSARYVLFNGFGDRARVSRAEAELYAEYANFDQTCANLEYNLRRAFAQQLYAQELIALAENIAVRRADNVRLIDMRYKGGRENKGSLLLNQAQHRQSLYDVEEAKRALVLARRQLATLMGEYQPDEFFVEGELYAGIPPERAALNELAAQTPTYRSAEANVKAAEQGYVITRSAHFPTITASGSAGRSGNSELENKSWSASISASVPLFQGGRLYHDTIAAGLARERTRLNAEQTMLELLNTLQDSLNSYTDRYETMGVQEELLRAAEMRAEVARAQYQQGLISFQDWDTIENSLINSQKSWLLSRRNADQAMAAWRNAQGISSIDQNN
ncbi:MAG: TolC family protein [Kiritimatiellales bacterium]